ncbi:OB-fold nucleic acid binding domain-containing protein [Apilactobacillus ozensis]|uniref:OB-fold nucleic acid binding domain-containing protein n=1 Tax=Apilactobacillus ozensis TaxID=866801 RepID=UPI00209267A9|nr:OB-fold nucleic acid binding domain-containing protein [Apilactobacillus ozensis]
MNGSDMSNEYTIVVFPEAYSTFKNYLKTGQVILVSGKVEASKKNNQIQLIAQNINLAVNLPKASSNKRLYLKIDKDKDNTDVWKKIHTVIKNNPGNTSIIIHREIDDSNKLLRKPYSINGTNSAINSLKLILGKDNAVYK